MAGSRFQTSRLKEARDAREIPTLTSLASIIGVNTSAVSRWESGAIEPTFEHVEMLAKALNVRPDFFYRPRFDHGGRPHFLRSLASARKRDLYRQRARMAWLQEIAQVVQHYVELPLLNLPHVLPPGGYRQLRDEEIEAIAGELRRAWGMGGQPVSNAVDVLERNGVVVGHDHMGTTALDGLCQWSDLDGRPYVLLASDKMSFFRRQMDAVHELAHAILHRDVTDEQLKVDFDIIERQAFRLASAFLMPADTFPLDVRVPTLSGFLAIKDRWRVSIKAMIRRCQDLDILDADDARQLYKYYSAKGWSREEPLDRSVEPAQPRVLASALRMIVENGARSKADLVASDFVFPGKDVAELVGLPEEWFSLGDVIPLRMAATKGPLAFAGTSEVVSVNFPGRGRR